MLPNLLQFPVAMFGVLRAGMVVVVRKDPALTERDVLAHCKQHLTAYKMPRIVEFRSEPLPKTNIGKILRRELRDDGREQRNNPYIATVIRVSPPQRFCL